MAVAVAVFMYDWIEMELDNAGHILSLIALATSAFALTFNFWGDFLVGGTPIKVGDEYLIVSSGKADKAKEEVPTVKELSFDWKKTYFRERNTDFDIRHGFLDRLADGRAHSRPRQELEKEYERLTSNYKESDQKLRQVMALIEGPGRKFTKAERREYLKYKHAVEKADFDAQPEKSARNRLIGRIHRARRSLEGAADEASQRERQQRLDLLEKELFELRKTGYVLSKKADEAKRAFEAYEMDLLNKWVSPESVGFDHAIVDRPMPDPVPPKGSV